MATGAYDSNGIWKYGEDDNISLFSTTLNKLADSVSAAETADRARLATLETGSLSGLIPVKASAITGVTGTVGTNSVGSITFTGCSVVQLDGIFTTTYRNYRIFISLSAASANTTSYARLVKSGTQNGTLYYGQTQQISGGLSTIVQRNNITYFDWAYIGSAGVQSVIEISRPKENTRTQLTFQAVNNDPVFWHGGFTHDVVDTFDGFLFGPNTGTITGTVTVYGYNN